ncbi:MAG: DUF6265 family protein [Planctomycetota bacterium]|nr:DUF6265 family protein [Planctomycetota bacterium]
MQALAGDWLYVEDRTEGREVEAHQPSMSAKFALRVEEAAVVVVRRDFEVRMPLDGTGVEVTREGRLSRYSGSWKDGAFTYEIEMLNPADKSRTGLIRTELRPTAEGLLARVEVESQTSFKSLALYRHPKDIALPTPAKATIADLAWLAGNWVGTRGTSGTTSIEERWSPPLGGAMLAVSRTVSKGKLAGFEYLRVVERDGGLVYVAQPGGNPPTEFVLTELSASRAVFENPRHDSPQRIVYELSGDSLSASVGYMKGGRPQRFGFKREGS